MRVFLQSTVRHVKVCSLSLTFCACTHNRAACLHVCECARTSRLRCRWWKPDRLSLALALSLLLRFSFAIDLLLAASLLSILCLHPPSALLLLLPSPPPQRRYLCRWMEAGSPGDTSHAQDPLLVGLVGAVFLLNWCPPIGVRVCVRQRMQRDARSLSLPSVCVCVLLERRWVFGKWAVVAWNPAEGLKSSRSPESGVLSPNVAYIIYNTPVIHDSNTTVVLHSEFILLCGDLTSCIVSLRCSCAVLCVLCVFYAQFWWISCRILSLHALKHVPDADGLSVITDLTLSFCSFSSFLLFSSHTAEHLPSRRGPHP